MNQPPPASISSRSGVPWRRLAFVLCCLALLAAGRGSAFASRWKPADITAWADEAQAPGEPRFALEIRTGILCGNDPVNKIDPRGDAEVSVTVGGITLHALSRREQLYNEAAQFRRNSLGPAADFRTGAPSLSGLDSALREMQALGRQNGFNEISDEDICATMALGREYQNSYNAAIKPYQDAQHAYVSSPQYVADAMIEMAPTMMWEAATMTADFVAMEALTAGMGTPLAGARMANRVRRLEEFAGTVGADANLVRNTHKYGHGFSLRNVNPNTGQGGIQNCVKCAIAADATLAGSSAVALPGLASPTFGGAVSLLEATYGGKVVQIASQAAIESAVAPLGARGIVIGYQTGRPFAHAFNVVNQRGTIRFLDAQIGGAAKEVGAYDRLWFIKTK